MNSATVKILVGSTSEAKLKIVTDLARQFFEQVSIQGMPADSGISDQPLSEEETVRGAINRVKSISSTDNYDIYLGLEGGLKKLDHQYSLICVVVALDRAGRKYTAVSTEIALPLEVSRAIDAGGQFGIAIRAYEQANKKTMSMRKKTEVEELISRKRSFSYALGKVLKEIKNAPLR